MLSYLQKTMVRFCTGNTLPEPMLEFIVQSLLVISIFTASSLSFMQGLVPTVTSGSYLLCPEAQQRKPDRKIYFLLDMYIELP